jgi:hypothetical protein
MNLLKEIKEEITFTPFDSSTFEELKSWMHRDSLTDIKATFGPHVENFTDINIPFTSTLADQSLAGVRDTISMVATIRTSYHSLIHIGYIYLRQMRSRNSKVCIIECIYVNRLFRQKDYEYRILKRLVSFALHELRCNSCSLWVYASNFLFLSIARTLNFRLARIQTDASGNNSRYCYAIVLQSELNKMQKELEQKYAIVIPSASRERLHTPNMIIPNYLSLKKNLLRINKLQNISKGPFKRRQGIFYSPILKEAKRFLSEESKQKFTQSWNEKDNKLKLVKDTKDYSSQHIQLAENYNSPKRIKYSNEFKKTSFTSKTMLKPLEIAK